MPGNGKGGAPGGGKGMPAGGGKGRPPGAPGGGKPLGAPGNGGGMPPLPPAWPGGTVVEVSMLVCILVKLALALAFRVACSLCIACVRAWVSEMGRTGENLRERP